jgi:hypothetical protein
VKWAIHDDDLLNPVSPAMRKDDLPDEGWNGGCRRQVVRGGRTCLSAAGLAERLGSLWRVW